MTSENFFAVTTENIWEGFNFSWKLSPPEWHENISPLHKRCLLELYRFLEFKNQVKGISEFRKELGYSHGYEIQNERRDLAMKGIYLGVGLTYKKNPNEPNGVNVKQNISPNYSIAEERPFFGKLFPFRFIQIQAEYRDKFLSFHLKKTFKNNAKQYKKFLLDSVIADSNYIIGNYADSLKLWINESLQSRKPKIKKIKNRSESFSVEMRAIIDDHLFKGDYQKTKVRRSGEIAYAYNRRLKSDDEKYNATSLCRKLHHDFGEKLGIKESTLIGYVKKDKMIENNSSKALFERISTIPI